MNNKKRYHFIGIGGIGMSSLAHILLQRGMTVSGSDLHSNYLTEFLQNAGAEIRIGHSTEFFDPSAIVVYSSAVSRDNPELAKAREAQAGILHRSDLLAQIMEGYGPLLVAGTHGKTTTSALLAHVLMEAGLNPGFSIGGMVPSLKSNGGQGTGPYFVAEADESDGSFLKYPALGAILTNIDGDHLDFWKTEQALSDAFKQFAEQVISREHFFWCRDDAHLSSFQLKGNSYGFARDADLRIFSARQDGWNSFFSFCFLGKEYLDVEIPMIGKHSILNAAAVFGLALSLQLEEKLVRKALKSFRGIFRRVEKKGEANQIEIYDDYAHHPTEIITTLKALKSAVKNKRLVVAFQPHRFTRTRDCMQQFSTAFNDADVLLLADIYPAGESPIEGVTSADLIKKIQDGALKQAVYVPSAELAQYLESFLQPNDVLVTMGAGDVTKLGPDLLKRLKEHTHSAK